MVGSDPPSPRQGRGCPAPSGVLPDLKLTSCDVISSLEDQFVLPPSFSCITLTFTLRRTFSRAFWRKTQVLIMSQTSGFFFFYFLKERSTGKAALKEWSCVWEIFLQRWDLMTFICSSLQHCFHFHWGENPTGYVPGKKLPKIPTCVQ